MKLTLESSKLDYPMDTTGTVVTIDCPCITIDDVMCDLVKPALLAWGFHPDNLPPLTEEEIYAYVEKASVEAR